MTVTTNSAKTGLPPVSQTYLRAVATRCHVPNSFASGNKQAYSRMTHVARDNIASLQVVLPNFNVSTASVETAPGGVATVTAAVEYPVGVFTQVRFSGSASGSISDGGLLTSDAVAVSIPFGEKFFVRVWYSNAAGILFHNSVYALATDQLAVGVTTSDLTMGGTAASASGNMYCASAIIAYTEKQAALIVGDSIPHGYSDSADGLGDIGYVARSIGPAVGYIDIATPSTLAQNFASATRTNRTVLAGYCTDVLVQFGTNDLAAARTAAQLSTDLATIAAFYPTQSVYMLTIPPRTTSTDSWVTTANQTVVATENARVTANNNIRQTISGSVGFFDIANVFETSINSGIWKVFPGGTPAYAATQDGIHGNRLGYTLGRSSGAVNPALFMLRNKLAP